MSQLTPISSIPYPDNPDSSRGDIHFTNMSDVIDTRMIPRFATTAARDVAIPSPSGGQVCYVTDLKAFQYYISGGGWTTQGFSKTSVLAADDVVTSSTTLANGTLTISLPAGTWELEGFIAVSADQGVDAKLSISATGATSALWRGIGPTLGTTDRLDTNVSSVFTGAGTGILYGTDGTGQGVFVHIHSQIITASTITVALMRAQNVSSATELTIHAGSFFRAARTTN